MENKSLPVIFHDLSNSIVNEVELSKKIKNYIFPERFILNKKYQILIMLKE